MTLTTVKIEVDLDTEKAEKQIADFSKSVKQAVEGTTPSGKGSGGGKTPKAVDDTTKSMNKATKSAKGFLASITRIAKYRLIRTMLKNLSQGLKEGITNLAAYDIAVNGANSSVNNTLSGYANIGLQLQNALGAAIMPLLSGFLPIAEGLSTVLLTSLDGFAQLTARLSGQETYWKVNTDYVKDYSASLQKARKQVLSFDELNVLQGQGIDYSKLYTETPVGEFDKNELIAVGELVGALGLVVGAVGKVNDAFKNKNNLLGKQTEATQKETSAVWDLSSAFGAALAGAGLLSEALKELLDKLKGLKGETPTVTVPETVPVEVPVLNPHRSPLINPGPLPVFNPFPVGTFPLGYKPTANAPSYNVGVGAEDPIAAGGALLGSWIASAISKVKESAFAQKVTDVVKGAASGVESALSGAGKTLATALLGVAAEAGSAKDRIKTAVATVGAAIVGGLYFGVAAPSGSGLGIPKAGNQQSFVAKANGGTVNRGQLFLANEAGPELVGRIGTKTTVTNQQQFTQGLADANIPVVNAVMAIGNMIVNSINSKDYAPVVRIGDRAVYNAYTRGKTLAGTSLVTR